MATIITETLHNVKLYCSVLVSRLGRNLRNAGGMKYLFAWRGYVTQQLLSAKALIAYIIVTVPTRNVLAADIFGTCIFHCHLVL
jgi:hypothetical protein